MWGQQEALEASKLIEAREESLSRLRGRRGRGTKPQVVATDLR